MTRAGRRHTRPNRRRRKIAGKDAVAAPTDETHAGPDSRTPMGACSRSSAFACVNQIAVSIDEYAIGSDIANESGQDRRPGRDQEFRFGAQRPLPHVTPIVVISRGHRDTGCGKQCRRTWEDRCAKRRNRRRSGSWRARAVQQCLLWRHRDLAPANSTRSCVPWIWNTAESSGRIPRSSWRLYDIAKRGIGLAHVGDEECVGRERSVRLRRFHGETPSVRRSRAIVYRMVVTRTFGERSGWCITRDLVGKTSLITTGFLVNRLQILTTYRLKPGYVIKKLCKIYDFLLKAGLDYKY